MKNISKKNKITLLLLMLLIISGIVTLFIAGFEKSIQYKEGTRIEVYISRGYEKQDIINIAKESFLEKEFVFEEVEKLNQVASIKIEEYTKEELDDFKTKICKKYDIKEDSLELHEISLPTTKISTIVEPYIFPTVLVTVLSLIYVLFINLKSENKWKKVLKILLILSLILSTYFSLILISRLPFGNFTMPLALAIYIITLIILVNNIKE